MKPGVIVLRLQTVRGEQILSEERMVAETIGAALDAYAPDPADGAEFRVFVDGKASSAEQKAAERLARARRLRLRQEEATTS